MKVLTCTSYKEHIKLYLEIYIKDRQNLLYQQILMQKSRWQFDNKGQDWEPPQIKDLKLVIPEHYIIMAPNIFFTALGILSNYIKKTTHKSNLPPG